MRAISPSTSPLISLPASRRPDSIVCVARDRRVNARNAQAAFLIFVLPAAAAEHRVDEHVLRFLRLALAFGIGHEQPIRQIDLVGGQADALVLVHQLEHLGDDLPQLGIDPLSGFERCRSVGWG